MCPGIFETSIIRMPPKNGGIFSDFNLQTFKGANNNPLVTVQMWMSKRHLL